MSSPSLAETPAAAGVSATPRGRRPVLPAVGSALLLWIAFPPADWGWFVWVALVPLFLLIPSKRSAWSLYLGAWVGGFVFWSLAIQWVRLTDATAWVAWLAMALGLSVFWPLFLVFARLGVHRLRLPLMIAAPVVWVALEYVRAYAVTGFPWYYLAHTQYAVLPMIQIADLTGVLGVSFVIAVVNAWIVDLLTLPLIQATPRGRGLTLPQRIRLAAVASLVGGTLLYGGFRLGTAHFRPGPRVALLQSKLIQRYRGPHNKDPHNEEQILAIYRGLINRAMQSEEKPDLIVWPETSYPYNFIRIDPAISRAELERQDRELSDRPSFTVERRYQQRDDITAHLHGWTDQLQVPMLVGSLFYDHRPEGLSKYNAALLFRPGEPGVQTAHKMHLVPFGEYVPLIETFPWLTVFTPYHGTYIPSLTHAREPAWLTLGPYTISAAICFEDTVPQVVRRFFRETPDGKHPDVVLNLSNDGWFYDSSEHKMHLCASIFRAVENRVPLARAANTGISAIVDGNGRVVDFLPTTKDGDYVEGVLSGVVPLDDRATFYSKWGDWLGQGCLAVTIGSIPMAFFYPNLRRSRIESRRTA